MADIQEAWKYYTWMAAFDFKHLPRAGGLADQDETLMQNIFRVAVAVGKLRKNG